MKKKPLTLTDALKLAIKETGTPLNAIEQATGVKRASLSRFMAGKTSLRLDIADRLAIYFGVVVTPGKGK